MSDIKDDKIITVDDIKDKILLKSKSGVVFELRIDDTGKILINKLS